MIPEEERIAKAERLFGPRPTGEAGPEKQAKVDRWQQNIDTFSDYAPVSVTPNEADYLLRFGLGMPVGWTDNLGQHLTAFPFTEPGQKHFDWLSHFPYKNVAQQVVDDKGNTDGSWAGQAVRNHQEDVIEAGGCYRREDLCAHLTSAPGAASWLDRNDENCRRLQDEAQAANCQ